MLDTHIDYYRTVAANMIINPMVVSSLSTEWEYQDRINQAIVNHLIQMSLLPGFSGSLSFGNQTDRDHSLNIGIPLPGWAASIQPCGINNPLANSDFGSEAEGVSCELDVDMELVIQFVERINILESAS
jgi:hypothetical protein